MINQPLFDNRYRYDHIYPRGRSGETLRAVDTHANDRPVVIKRPAPQDAPPLRAAQEVSILNEKKALERLSGHPALTELRGSGTFRAGGSTYQYIVMDRAEGETLENMVLELAPQKKRPPELEMLVILDTLLDLLIAAHDQHVVYNDVDAKHLFWDRDAYRLKVIDWGNAVMLDEANHPSGVTIASDVYQVGELLYFIYNSGKRLASETTPEGDYSVIFSQDVPPPIQEIITRATHPNIKTRRYANLRTLRQELTAYRQPLERQRDQAVHTVQAKLIENASQQLLHELTAELTLALQLDPGYPPARHLRDEIHLRLQHLAVQADFDAARIYLETGNWSRAVRLIEELIPNADPQMARALTFLVAAAEQFQQQGHTKPPEDFPEIMESVLNNKAGQAARILLAIAEHDRDYRDAAMLAAERLAVLMPTVVLLRPHLVRLEKELHPLSPTLAEEVAGLGRKLNARIATGITPLTERYAKLAIQLADWMPDYEALTRQRGLASETLTSPADRAQAAARRIVDHLRHAAETAYSQPDTAREHIEAARLIDPFNKHFAELESYLEQVREVIQSLATFRPRADGSDLLDWLEHSRADLQPFRADLTDNGILAASKALETCRQEWLQTQDMLILGRIAPSAERLHHLASTIQRYNAHVADWLDNTARLVREASAAERFAPNQALSQILLEGYEAWDQGQAGRAADCARRALVEARSQGEKFAAERLGKLAEITSRWLNERGTTDRQLTDKAEQAAFALLLEDEAAEYERFSHQMKSEDLYLKAMKRGIVAYMQASSPVGFRALFLHYVWRGMLEVQEGNLDDADFWRQAALITHQTWLTHPVFTAFDGELTRRKLIRQAEAALNSITSRDDLAQIKHTLNAPLVDPWLKAAQQAISLVESAFKNWGSGDFRASRDHFNQALDSLTAAENDSGMQLEAFRTWLIPYQDRVLELVERRQIVDQAAMAGSTKADPDVLRALEQIVEISEATLGEEYSRQVRLWRDMYKTMLKTHLNRSATKREKLAEFEANFSALFIDKHPAYKLFLRWQEAARALPDDVQEDVQIELDTTGEAPIYLEEESSAEAFQEEAPIVPRRPVEAAARGGRAWNAIIIGAGIILLSIIVFGVYRMVVQPEETSSRGFEATPTRAAALDPLNATHTAEAAGILPPPTKPPATATPTRRPPTDTPLPPSATPLPSDTPTPTEVVPTIAPTLTPTPIVTIVTNTPPPPPTLTPTLPAPTAIALAPDIGGEVNILDILNLIQPQDYDWEPTFFGQGAGGIWQLGAAVEEAGNAPIAVVFSPQFMEAFNPAMGLRLRKVEIQMELTLFDEDRIESGQVFFGLGLQNASRQRYSAQVQVRRAGVVSLGINENGTFRAISQIPLSPVRVTLSIQRNDDGSAVFFINGQRLGESPKLYPTDQPVSVVLYNAGGGMFVAVSSFTAQLAPYTP